MWNYYRDELTDEANDNNDPNKNVINSKSFKYKTSITGNTYNVPRGITGTDGNPANNPNYYQFKRDESPINDAGNPNNVTLDNSTSSKYKASLLGKATDADGNDRSLKNAILVVIISIIEKQHFK